MIFIIALIIIVYYVFSYKKENFQALLSGSEMIENNASYRSQYDKTKQFYTSYLSLEEKPEINCCLVNKNFNSQYGVFDYNYYKLKNEMCDLNKHQLDNSNAKLFIEGENNWHNIMCENRGYIGSCKNANNECIDFVTKDFCDSYRMEWSNQTCKSQVDYTWNDKQNRPDREQLIPDLEKTKVILF